MNSNSGPLHYAFWIALSCCILCGVTVGLTYSCAGIFILPVSQAMGVGVGTVSFYLTVQGLAVTVFLPVAGKLIATKDSRFVLSAAVLIVGLVFLLNSRWTSIYPFYVTAVFMGFAQAFMLVLVTPTLINNWFKEKVGLVLGICLSFTGVGGIVFNPLGMWIILHYDWRTAYLVFGAIVLVLCLPLTLFVVRRTPAEKGLLRYGENSGGKAGNEAAATETGVSKGLAVKTAAFYAIAVMSGFIAINSSQLFHIPAFAQSLGKAAAMGGAMASVVMAGNLIGKIIIGWLMDKNLNMALTFGCLCGIVCFLLFTMGGGLDYALYTGAFLFGISYAMAVTIPPMYTRRAFGRKDYAQIYALVSMAAMLVNSFASSAWGFLKESQGSYAPGFWLCVALLLLSIICGVWSLQAARKLQHE